MQPAILALIITLLPLLASNAVYLLSAYEGTVPWCIPYIDGCTSISRAARSGNSIFLYRAPMIAYGVLLIWFWIYAYQWLTLLHGHKTRSARIIMWLGISGAIALIVYINFLGSDGVVYRFMRRHGIMLFFTLTPLAQLLLLKQHFQLAASNSLGLIKPKLLRYQLVVLVMMLVIAYISILLDVTRYKTDASENIVEWNFALLLAMYFAVMIFIWKDYRYHLRSV